MNIKKKNQQLSNSVLLVNTIIVETINVYH
jgi:hypothetical protein